MTNAQIGRGNLKRQKETLMSLKYTTILEKKDVPIKNLLVSH